MQPLETDQGIARPFLPQTQPEQKTCNQLALKRGQQHSDIQVNALNYFKKFYHIFNPLTDSTVAIVYGSCALEGARQT
jgi:hypothetical protein